jgi:hypothetical protein
MWLEGLWLLFLSLSPLSLLDLKRFAQYGTKMRILENMKNFKSSKKFLET